MRNKYILLCLLLAGCHSQSIRQITIVVPPSPIAPSYETNRTVPLFTQQVIIQLPPRTTNAISLGWDISPADMGSTIYLIYGAHNINPPQAWIYLGSTTGLVCTITDINLAPTSIFRIVASNTYTHITSEQLVKQLQQ